MKKINPLEDVAKDKIEMTCERSNPEKCGNGEDCGNYQCPHCNGDTLIDSFEMGNPDGGLYCAGCKKELRGSMEDYRICVLSKRNKVSSITTI